MIRIGLAPLLAIIFMVLKLTHYIDWSWGWILSPVWICLLVWAVASAAVFLLQLRD